VPGKTLPVPREGKGDMQEKLCLCASVVKNNLFGSGLAGLWTGKKELYI
jgi:hypothetical protein